MVQDRYRGKIIFDGQTPHGLPTITINGTTDGTHYIVTIQSRTHEIGDTIANANAQNSKLLAAAVTSRAADTITDPNDAGANKLPVWLRPALLIGAGIVVLVVLIKLISRKP